MSNAIEKSLDDSNIQVTEWSPYSLNLKPIEILKRLLKESIYQNYLELLTMQDKAKVPKALTIAAKEACNNMPKSVNKFLCFSIVECVKAIT